MKLNYQGQDINIDDTVLNKDQQNKLKDFLKSLYKDEDPYDIEYGESFWFINLFGEIIRDTYANTVTDKKLMKNGNYCKDEEVMKWLAAFQTLNCLMLKYSIQHGGKELLDGSRWETDVFHKYFCHFNHNDHKWYVHSNIQSHNNEIYFINRQIAENCIEEVIIPFCKQHPELGYN